MELVKNIYWVGVNSEEYQTSSNAYLIKTQHTYILVDTVLESCWDEFNQHINAITKIENIKYLIVNHSGLDHIGCIENLLKINPNLKIVASKTAYYYLRAILEQSVVIIGVGDYDVLHIDDLQVTFLIVPNLCWPDTMFTYIDKHQLLFSCEVFSSTMVTNALLCSNNPFKEQYKENSTQYLSMQFNGFKTDLMRAIDKLKQYPLKMIAPGHGLIIDEAVNDRLIEHENFCKESSHNNQVVICYSSNYGLTADIARAIQLELTNYEIDCISYDLNTNYDAAIKSMKSAKGLIFGSSTHYQDASEIVYQAMNTLSWACDGYKLISSFGSYGWSGEAVEHLLVRAKQMKMTVLDEGLRINFKLKEHHHHEIEQFCEGYVKHFLEFIDNN